MNSHFSRSAQPLPGVRELFPDLFHPRPMPFPNVSPLSATHDSQPQQHTLYDVTNPPLEIFRPFQFSSNPSTAQDTATSTTDHPHRYTRAHIPFHSHVSPHATHHPSTQRWPNHDPATNTPLRSASPEELSPRPQPRLQIEDEVVSSNFPDNERPSPPMTSSPHVPSSSAELPPQSTSFEQRSLESHSDKKRHKCNICGSYWGRPSSLKIHMVSHTGVKEFVCSICKQDFGVKSNYTRHIRVHHKDSSEGIQTRAAGRRRCGSRRTRDVGPVRFVDEGPKFQGQ